MSYDAPLDDILYMLRHVGQIDELLASGVFPDIDADLISSVLSEAGSFAEDVLAPLNRVGDQVGARYEQGRVALPPGFAAAFHQWRDGGWNGLAQPAEWGGMGLPVLANIAATEMWTSGCMALMTSPPLTQGAADALAHHAGDEIKALLLPRLVAGEWTASMCLTEPQAGSDVGAATTRAEPDADGAWRLYGSKIFITFAEHDAAENIVHLVLARTPGAPEGTRGISLFAAPKFMIGPDGSLGERNAVTCTGIEEKMGLHGSPTCSLSFEGAKAWLVGAENQGMACMFTMMNRLRLCTALQGVAVAERATQDAIGFAHERVQGRPPGQPPGTPIIGHPDVKRMLLTMRALTYAARAITYRAARAIDDAETSSDPALVGAAQLRAGLLTPLAKAFGSEVGCEAASLCIQVHGGMGFVEETGVAQYLRDIRIAPIYEGSNGIQAIDLLTRKVQKDGGAEAGRAIAEWRETAQSAADQPDLQAAAEAILHALDALESVTALLLRPTGVELALASASPYLRLFALTAGGALLLKAAAGRQADPAAPAGERMIAATQFFAANLLPEVHSLVEVIQGGAQSVLTSEAALA